jgi:hypothetical protein
MKRQVNIRTPAGVCSTLLYRTIVSRRLAFCVWSSAVESSSVSGRQMAQPY